MKIIISLLFAFLVKLFLFFIKNDNKKENETIKKINSSYTSSTRTKEYKKINTRTNSEKENTVDLYKEFKFVSSQTKQKTHFDSEQAEIIGREGEAFFNNIARTRLGNDYFVLDNIVLKSGHGTTQIDQIIVSKFGIFVVEIKNYKGWIFGDVDDVQWTQTLINAKYQFQNPLKQNYKHIKAVQSLLDFSEGIKSLIVFADSAEFKTQLANNVVVGETDYINFIKKHR